MSGENNLRVAVLASGRGSNLQALLDAAQDEAFPAKIIGVLSDKSNAQALERAKKAGIKSLWVDPSKDSYEERLGDEIETLGCGLICCAGYMKILTPKFVGRFSGKIINIHPSLLPSFPGLHSQRKALRAGVQIAGCTVHFIDEGVDTGPVILQAAVPVMPGDDEDSLSARILGFEHRIYPMAVRLIAEGKIRLDGRRVHVEGLEMSAGGGFFSPPVTFT
ncbi:MAG: phosphoribosylglycinamide formyltransferase [Nitrospinaceae bacterium]|jgi:phosphoribosylglycinamide formyltransferase 1|nr:phosphoribosylglycinamide formyltransferase [Nitrospinaceae bacterium]MBT3433163.1 phosphoribosylglycinamide formyltransferase [Nitrospinaceae bacterium]MBT3823084.1 phosphoribosylglycinamide formyltransferase [Nitrospinaceae bacterium]MBT4092330.1 phosphoribosylglycinamide formyltransferase [Nitrospinaceae bacterium]MBT4432277.1 phosphoribosylglycinamide formyltransferase [Nitrospinaceae bacterium]